MDSVYQKHNPRSGSELYLKLKDGDRVKLRIASEPAISVYKEGDRPRYSWIVFNRDTARPQIYSSGVSIFSQLRDLEQEWGAITDFDVVIKRTGSGLNDTEYSVTPVKQSDDLTKEQLEEVDKIDLPSAIKGKWLADYVDDGVLPDPITDGSSEPTATNQPKKDVVIEDIGDEPISLDSIPF